MTNFSIKTRILAALKEHKCSLNRLGDGDKALSRKMQRQINEETDLSAATICIILNRFPDISAEWLLRGTGEMLLNTTTTRQRDDNDTATSADVTLLRDQLRRKDREIDGLYERIEELKRGTAPQTFVATA